MANAVHRKLFTVTAHVYRQQSKRRNQTWSLFRKSKCARQENAICKTALKNLRLSQPWMRNVSSSGDNVVTSPVPHIVIPDETIPEFVWKNVEQYPDHKALTCGVNGRSYNYKEARSVSRKFGAALLKSGLRPGDVLAIMLPNIPEYALVLLGALEAGILVSTINPIYTKNEIVHQVSTSEAKFMVTLPSLVPTVKEAIKMVETSMPVITVSYDEARSEGTWDFDDMIKSNVDQNIRNPSQTGDVAVLPFSSGTTGLSKGVMLTHRNIVSNVLQLSNPPFNIFRETTSEHQDVLPTVLPFFHLGGMSSLFRGLSHGLHIISLPKFEPQTYLSVISSQKPLTTLLICAPPLVMFLGSHPFVETEDLTSLRVIANCAAPVGPSDIQRLLDKLPNRKAVAFCNWYGLTETSPCVFAPMAGNTDLVSVGVPVPNTQIRVVDTHGNNAGPKKNGEIYVKGPQVMKGYYKNDKANAEAFKNEWFKTGDVGYYDERRRFYVVERVKDIIKVKSFQVAPAELEAVLRSHPGVAEAGVVGVPDERAGEKPVAFVVPKPGVKFESDKVLDFVAQQVAPFKKLAEIVVTDSIPKNLTGKILRRILREQYSKTR